MGGNGKQRETRGDKVSGRRTHHPRQRHHPTQAHMWEGDTRETRRETRGDNGRQDVGNRQWETKGEDLGKADTPSNKGKQEGV